MTTDKTITVNASYTENGVTKSASQAVTIKATALTVSSLAISGAATLQSLGQASLSVNAKYSDGSSKAVSAAWSSSDPVAATISGSGVVFAGAVTVDTRVTLTATYTERGVTVSASHTLTITAAPATLASVTIAGVTRIQDNARTTFKATARYGDGSQRQITPSWSATPSSLATISNRGILSVGEVSADTPVTVTAAYSEGGVTQAVSHTVTVGKPCPPTISCVVSGGVEVNLNALSIIGAQSSLAGGATLALNAEALYDDGSRKPVNATWSVSNTSAATITPGGSLTANPITAITPVTVSAGYTEGSIAKGADYIILVLPSLDALPGSRIQAEVTTQGVFNSFGLSVIVKIDSATANRYAAAGYQVFVIAILPDSTTESKTKVLILDRAKNWGVVSWPVKAFLENVQDTNEVEIEILSSGSDISKLSGASYWVGWGTNVEEMLAAARYKPVFMVP